MIGIVNFTAIFLLGKIGYLTFYVIRYIFLPIVFVLRREKKSAKEREREREREREKSAFLLMFKIVRATKNDF